MEDFERGGVAGAEGDEVFFACADHFELDASEGGPVVLADYVFEQGGPGGFVELEADLEVLEFGRRGNEVSEASCFEVYGTGLDFEFSRRVVVFLMAGCEFQSQVLDIRHAGSHAGKGLVVLCEDPPANYSAVQEFHFQSSGMSSKQKRTHLPEA